MLEKQELTHRGKLAENRKAVLFSHEGWNTDSGHLDSEGQVNGLGISFGKFK